MNETHFGDATLYLGDCLDVLRTLPDASVDSVVTDPPYGLSFMGKRWDYDVPSVEIWAECLRVLKPGGHLLAFAGTRTQHRMAVRIEDAGFEIRDMLAWLYGSGFPKSLDVSKALDKAEDYKLQAAHRRAWVEAVQEAGLYLPGNSRHDWTVGEHAPGNKWWAEFEAWLPGLSGEKREAIERIVVGKGFKPRPTFHTADIGGEAEANEYAITTAATDAARQWEGWGTALKPALEPITMARKPLAGTVAANVLEHGTGALNIDGCMVEADDGANRARPPRTANAILGGGKGTNLTASEHNDAGRWPANVLHDGSDEVLAHFPDAPGQPYAVGPEHGEKPSVNTFGDYGARDNFAPRNDTGSAARFFYCAKASKADRDEGLSGFDVVKVKTKSGGGAPHNGRSASSDGGMRANVHPTVKPTDLMRYLLRLVTPPGGTALDPFMGSGSTGKAALLEHFKFIGIERDPDYLEIAKARIDYIRRSGVQVGLFGEAA